MWKQGSFLVRVIKAFPFKLKMENGDVDDIEAKIWVSKTFQNKTLKTKKKAQLVSMLLKIQNLEQRAHWLFFGLMVWVD